MKTLQGLKSISITEQGTSTWELKTTNDFLKFRHASLSIAMTAPPTFYLIKNYIR